MINDKLLNHYLELAQSGDVPTQRFLEHHGITWGESEDSEPSETLLDFQSPKPTVKNTHRNHKWNFSMPKLPRPIDVIYPKRKGTF